MFDIASSQIWVTERMCSYSRACMRCVPRTSSLAPLHPIPVARHMRGFQHHRPGVYSHRILCVNTGARRSRPSQITGSLAARCHLSTCTTMPTEFTSIPTIDLDEVKDPAKRPRVLEELRHVLLNVGFLYIRNHGVSEQTIQDLVDALPVFFNLTKEEKGEIGLLNSPHFLGYSGIGAETTAGKVDVRQQFEFATELEDTWFEGRPLAERLKGPNQVCNPQHHALVLHALTGSLTRYTVAAHQAIPTSRSRGVYYRLNAAHRRFSRTCGRSPCSPSSHFQVVPLRSTPAQARALSGI